MTPKNKLDNPKSYAMLLLENILFVVCVVVIALRTTYTETPTLQTSQIDSSLNGTVYSLCLSGILIFALLFLLLVKFLTGRFSYRFSSIEIGLVIFFIAAISATFYAANKRAAINSSIILLAPLLMIILLTQLLDSHHKIKIMLIVIVALGFIASWLSSEQFFVSNDIMVQQYEDDPNSLLEPLGIKPGSMNHILFENHLYAKDVRAAFTTGNSVGSFAILTSFASIALLAELLKNRKLSNFPIARLIPAVMVAAFVLFGLILTHSKGAIAAFLVALIIFALLLLIKRPKLFKNIILIAFVIGALALVPTVIYLGLHSDRLPGGNSVLVRWQYWLASAKILADHPLTGVGPGNFTTAYYQYKIPAALETVSDPHSFVLNLITQYGPLGLLAFLAIIIIPLWRASLTCPAALEKPSATRFKKLITPCVLAPALIMPLLRPFLLPSNTAFTYLEKTYVVFTAYIAPAAAFVVAFWLLLKSIQSSKDNSFVENTSLTSLALLSALLGVLIHNLVDFAIFEPGVMITFCAELACLIALNQKSPPEPKKDFAAPLWLKPLAIVVFVILIFCFFLYALVPVAKSNANIAKARRYSQLGQFPLAHSLLADATNYDSIGPDAPAINGRLYLQHLYYPNMQQTQMLDDAEQALFTAIERNPVDFRNFEVLVEIYTIRSRAQPGQKNLWLQKALDTANIAISLYPGDAELHIQAAMLAQELGQLELALEQYEKAVKIEDDFRVQFRLMYPGREVFSRLPKELYLRAKKQIEELSPLRGS